ncbi:hypothetical protein NGM10_12150 [Halorussus salilacus]|uniref:hypothetical protein n=1 Tax=Halorussus salilacus TaxID=2953750 RepID=UPI0020A21AF9|nr:hypothetical protein [Halorussus salilacus]USZ67476.1 hypothetical protein NGM10_12150 [Halorussus salilacus]
MVGNEDDARVSRRSVLRGATGLAGIGLAGASASARTSETQSEEFEGFVCGSDPTEGETFTVEPRCDGDCEVIRATGLAPDCSGGREDIYVDLHGTDPTVWVTPTDDRTGAIRPGTYRFAGVERCGGAAPACDGDALHRVRFRPERG